jgi:hypothetical protein
MGLCGAISRIFPYASTESVRLLHGRKAAPVWPRGAVTDVPGIVLGSSARPLLRLAWRSRRVLAWRPPSAGAPAKPAPTVLGVPRFWAYCSDRARGAGAFPRWLWHGLKH